ncbi:MAG: helix-turn-helix domain-containing protein [Bacilli bacterium]
MKINIRLKLIRVMNGYTQEEIAQTFCTKVYVSRIESGKVKPSNGYIQHVLKRLNLKEEILLTDSEKIALDCLQIVDKYKVNRKLTSNELYLLEFYLAERVDRDECLGVKATLLKYYVCENEINNADRIYEVKSNFSHEGTKKDLRWFKSALGDYWYSKQNFSVARVAIEEALEILEGDPLEFTYLYYSLSLLIQRIDLNYEEAIGYCLRALDCANRYGIKDMQINCEISMGVLNYLSKQFDTAVLYFERAQTKLSKTDSREVMLMYHRGRILEEQGEYTLAKQYFEDVLKLIPNFQKERIYPIRRLVELHYQSGMYREARLFVEEGLEIVKRYKLEYLEIEMIRLHLVLCRKLNIDGDYENGMKTLVEQARESKSKGQVRMYARELADHFYSRGAYKHAAYYYRLVLDDQRP